MTAYPLYASFSRGELAPRLHGRADIDHYQMSLAEARNYTVMRQGGLYRRAGFQYIAATKYADKLSRLIEFEFNIEQAYALEFGDQYIRFHTLGAQVRLSGSPYEVATPYLEADLFALQVAQVADTVYIVHPNYAPRKLVRKAETNWALSVAIFKDGPYLEEDTQGVTLAPSGRASITPEMTSNTAPSGVAAVSGTGASEAWRAFDLAISGRVETGVTGLLSYTFPGGTTKVADAYWIVAPSTFPDDVPVEWKFQGYDGTNWFTLDARSGESSWGANERRFYTFVNKTAYQAYRLVYSGGGGADFSGGGIAELGIHESGETQVGFFLTASATTGINGGAGFVATDIDRPIRGMGSDGRWRWARIVSVSSPTVVVVRLYGHALPDYAPFSRWQMGAFSATSGFPRAVGFFKERLAFGGTPKQPLGVWLSRSADYENFGTSEPVQANDAVSLQMTGGRFNQISFLEEMQDLAVGTGGSLRVVGKSDPSEPFGPDNARQEQQSTIGAYASQPVVVGGTAIFSDRYGKRLYEYAFSFESNAYVAEELSILSDHLTRKGVVEMAFQQNPDNLVMCPVTDGSMTVVTYEKKQQIAGFTPWVAGGANAKMESVAVIPSAGGDTAYAIVSRTINGAPKRYVEYQAKSHVEGEAIADGIYFDSALTYVGAATGTVSGLLHLRGETVGILADGVDIGDAVVGAGGAVSLPDGITAAKITVGLRYKSRGVTLRMPQAGNRDGSALGRKKAVTNLALDVLDTAGLMAGTKHMDETGKLQELVKRSTSTAPGSAMNLGTGFFNIPTTGRQRDEGVVVFETDRGYPAMIRALVPAVDGEP
jgi:hypothetical protein